MKRVLIAALICINVGLLAWLLVKAGTGEAQALSGEILRNNYIMITGQIREHEDGLYVLDLGTKRLAAWHFDLAKKSLRPLGMRRLSTDIPTRKP